MTFQGTALDRCPCLSRYALFGKLRFEICRTSTKESTFSWKNRKNSTKNIPAIDVLNCTLQTTNLKEFPTTPLYRITLSKFRHIKSVVVSIRLTAESSGMVTVHKFIIKKSLVCQVHMLGSLCSLAWLVRSKFWISNEKVIHDGARLILGEMWNSNTTPTNHQWLCAVLTFSGCVCLYEMFAWNVTNSMKYEHTPKVRFIATDHKYLTSKTFVKNYLTKKTV